MIVGSSEGHPQGIDPTHGGKPHSLVQLVVIDQHSNLAEKLEGDSQRYEIVATVDDIQDDEEGFSVPVLNVDMAVSIF